MDCVIVSHTHWDREWYRTFQAFRARLVDSVDRVLDLLDSDPGWSFVLDGQTIVVEDYLAVRPDQVDRLAAACRDGRLAIGPWYVQPDSLLPGGESHVRNLLEGRRVGEEYGPVSRVAYTPDSFGHPSQFPQIFVGFGLDGFTYWRGNGDEFDTLPPVYRWVAPDGSSVVTCHLPKGYFAAATLPDDVVAAVKRLREVGEEMIAAGATRLLFLNGVDHALPDANTGVVASALQEETGWRVVRGRLEDYTAPAIASVRESDRFTGELIGGRMTNLLPGVWSSRLGLKLSNRRAETALAGWAEPWAALGRALGLADERPALRMAWRALLANQAHDSIGGCSQDRVHQQMEARFDEAEELADETTARLLSRLAGLGPDRAVPWTDEVEVGVFNSSPHPRTELVRFPLDGHPFTAFVDGAQGVHPLTLTSLLGGGITVDGMPARVLVDDSPGRVRVIPEQQPWTVEWVAEDVPAFGWRRYRIARGEAAPDDEDDEREIITDAVTVSAADDGTLTVVAAGHSWEGLGAVEDQGDRGDTYDFDPVPGPVRLASVGVSRRRHASGIAELDVVRVFDVPTALGRKRRERSAEMVPVTVRVRARVAPGVERVDLEVTVDNTARDHRLRLGFPTGAAGDGAVAATTFDIAPRSPRPAPATKWFQPQHTTFPQQGWVHNNGLTVVAPGLPGGGSDRRRGPSTSPWCAPSGGCPDWISTPVRNRPVPVWWRRGRSAWVPQSPASRWSSAANRRSRPPTPSSGSGPRRLDRTRSFHPEGACWNWRVRASSFPPSSRLRTGPVLVARVLNPTDRPVTATLRWGAAVGGAVLVRLDEEPMVRSGGSVDVVAGYRMRLTIPPHALRSVLVKCVGSDTEPADIQGLTSD